MINNRIADLGRRLHGVVYECLLPLIIRPPRRLHQGKTRTFVRVAVMQFLESWKECIHGRVLDVGAGTWSYPRKLYQARCAYTTTDCFDHPDIDVVSDIHQLTETFETGVFDFVICTDVLEHISYPWLAIKELYLVLKPGGLLLLTTPFNFHLHGELDNWRISGDGLRILLQDVAGFTDVDIIPVGHVEFPFCHLVVARK